MQQRKENMIIGIQVRTPWQVPEFWRTIYMRVKWEVGLRRLRLGQDKCSKGKFHSFHWICWWSLLPLRSTAVKILGSVGMRYKKCYPGRSSHFILGKRDQVEMDTRVSKGVFSQDHHQNRVGLSIMRIILWYTKIRNLSRRYTWTV